MGFGRQNRKENGCQPLKLKTESDSIIAGILEKSFNQLKAAIGLASGFLAGILGGMGRFGMFAWTRFFRLKLTGEANDRFGNLSGKYGLSEQNSRMELGMRWREGLLFHYG
eukprot:COSAG04_NODE_13796_length_592_cov_0.734280_2_plen_111_part_00